MAKVFKAAGFSREIWSFENRNVGRFIKYHPYGLLFRKWTIFTRYSGRPVLYLPDCDLQWIGAALQWRVVRYEFPGSQQPVDWTHEREWRAPMHVDFGRLPQHELPLVVVFESIEKKLLDDAFRAANQPLPWEVIALSELA
jgi:hypothetical protein